MDEAAFHKLRPGDVVRHVGGAEGYTVERVADRRGAVTIIRRQRIHNPAEWELIAEGGGEVTARDYSSSCPRFALSVVTGLAVAGC